MHSLVLEARGQYPEAEAAYRRAEAFRRAGKDLQNSTSHRALEQMILAADGALLSVARNETKQGRLSEAEAERYARARCSASSREQGKYAPATTSRLSSG